MNVAKTMKQWRGEGWVVEDGSLTSDGAEPLLPLETPKSFVLQTEILGPRRFRILLARGENNEILAFEADRSSDRARFLLLDDVRAPGIVLKENRLSRSMTGDRSQGRVIVRVSGGEKIYRVNLNERLFTLDLNSDEEGIGVELIDSWGRMGSAFGYFMNPESIWSEDDGDIHVLGINDSRLQKLDPDGVFKSFLDLEERFEEWSGGWPNQYRGIKRGPNGDLHAIDTNRQEIVRFDSNGRITASMGGYGSGDGFLFYSDAVSTDGNGDILVLDISDRAVHRFSADGEFVSRAGGREFGVNFSPNSAAADGEGGLYLFDAHRQEINRFDEQGRRTAVFGGKGGGDGYMLQPYSVVVDEDGFTYAVDAQCHGVHKFAPNGDFVFRIGGRDEFTHPTGLAIDGGGNLLVADSLNRIIKIDSEGKRLGAFEFPAGGEYVFGNQMIEYQLAVNAKDEIYISDLNNSRVWKFSAEGEYILHWGRRGAEPGMFAYPSGIAVDKEGDVYVADGNNNRIQKFNGEGEFIWTMGTAGNGTDQFRYPRDIGLNDAGEIFVADHSNNRVQKFAPDRTFLKSWTADSRGTYKYVQRFHVKPDGGFVLLHGSYHTLDHYSPSGEFLAAYGKYGPGKGMFQYATAMARGPSGNLYVLDQSSFRITKFSAEGSVLKVWGSQGSTGGAFQYGRAMAVDAHENVHLLDNTFKLHTFDSDGGYLRTISLPTVNTGNHGMAVDGEGNIYLLDSSGNLLRVFNSAGSQTRQWGGTGANDGQFTSVRSVTLSPAGEVVISDGSTTRIQVFDKVGKFIRKFGTMGSAHGRFRNATDFVVDDNGDLIVTDGQDGTIQKLDSGGQLLFRFGGKGTGNGLFNYAMSVTADDDRNMYVIDYQNHRIQKFNAKGEFLKTWGSQGSGHGQFHYPRRIVCDGKEFVYVLDGNNFRVQKFTLDGAFAAAWGSRGTGESQFQSMMGLEVSPLDRVYVGDQSRGTVKHFDVNGTFKSEIGGRRSGDGSFSYASCMAAAPDGFIYVLDQGGACIHKFNAAGEFVMRWGKPAREGGLFTNPSFVLVDGRNIIYVADYGLNYLQKFDDQGNFLGRFASFGRTNSLAKDKDNNIIIADQSNQRILIYNPDGNQIAAWGDRATIGHPTAIVADPEGGIFVADGNTGRLRNFSRDGRENYNVGGTGRAPGLFQNVRHMIFDHENTMLVADSSNQRVQRLDARGRFLMQWSVPRRNKHEYPQPISIAVNAENDILVLEHNRRRILKYRFVSIGLKPSAATGLYSYSSAQRWSWLSLASEASIITPRVSSRVVRESTVYPPPQLESLEPSIAAPGQEVVLRGSDFSRDSRVYVAGIPHATRFLDLNELRFTVSSAGGPVFVREGDGGRRSPEPLELKIRNGGATGG